MYSKILILCLTFFLAVNLILTGGCIRQGVSGDQATKSAEQENGSTAGGENEAMITAEEGQTDNNDEELWSEPEELSLEKYGDTYGWDLLEADPITAVAQQVGAIAINSAVLSETELKQGDRFQLCLFDGEQRTVEIEKILFTADTMSFMGSTPGPVPGIFYLSVTGDQVLAHLRLAEENILYLVKVNATSGKHYLFEAPFDQIEVPEEDTPLGVEDFFNIER